MLRSAARADTVLAGDSALAGHVGALAEYASSPRVRRLGLLPLVLIEA